MSDVAPAAQPNPPKTPRKRTAPPTGISDQDMERFKTWIEDKSRYKSSGGFIPYLRKIMQDEDIEGLSTNNFHKKPRDGKRLVIFYALWGRFVNDQSGSVEEPAPVENEPEIESQLVQDLVGLGLAEQEDDEDSPSIVPCTTAIRAATWNCQQLQFVFKPKRLAEIAQYLAANFDLVLLQEIPTGHYGPYRLNQLVSSMNSIGEKFAFLLGQESQTSSAQMLNAIIYPARWKILRQTTLSTFPYPPVVAWFRTEEGSSTILAATFHISPSVGVDSGDATPSKASSSASMGLIQNRLHRQLASVVEVAGDWEVSIPTVFDKQKLCPRWIIGGDLNVVPDSLPYGLVYTTPAGMPTAVLSGRTLDGFLVDPLTARTHNTLVQLAKVNRAVSDHHIVSMTLKEYV